MSRAAVQAASRRQVFRPSAPGRVGRTELSRRYAVSGARRLGSGLQTTSYTDVALRQFGPRLFDRMALDPIIRAGIERLVVTVTGEQPVRRTRVPEGSRRRKRGEAMADLCNRAYAALPNAADTLEAHVRDAAKHGNKAGEVTLRPGRGQDAKYWVYDSWIALKREATAYVQDEEGDTRWLLVHTKGAGALSIGGLTFHDAELVDIEKFTVLTVRGDGTCPLGESLLLPLVASWNLKQLMLPERVKYARKRVAPPTVVILGKKDEPDQVPVDEAGNPVPGAKPMSAADVAARKAAQLDNHGAMALPWGGNAKQLGVSGEGGFLERFCDWCDRQNLVGLVLSALGMLEEEHGTKAKATIADIQVDFVAAWLKRKTERMLERMDALLVLANEPDGEDLIPTVSLGDTERKDWAAVAAAIVPLIKLLAALGYWAAINDLIASVGLPTLRSAAPEIPAPAAAGAPS